MRHHEDIFRMCLTLFLATLAAASRPAVACSDISSEYHITRARPVASVPEGAVQLQVDVPYEEDDLRSRDSGSVVLPVRKVANGTYTGNSVRLSYINRTSCEYFGPTGSNLYVVVYPLIYDEGDPVKDDAGNPIIEVIRYNYNTDPKYIGIVSPPPYGPGDIMTERKVYSCVRRGSYTDEAMDKCLAAKNPDALYRLRQSWIFWLSVAGAVCISIVFVAIKRTSHK